MSKSESELKANRRYYNTYIRNRGVCRECGGPCSARYTRCHYCAAKSNGAGLARMARNKQFERDT